MSKRFRMLFYYEFDYLSSKAINATHRNRRSNNGNQRKGKTQFRAEIASRLSDNRRRIYDDRETAVARMHSHQCYGY